MLLAISATNTSLLSWIFHAHDPTLTLPVMHVDLMSQSEFWASPSYSSFHVDGKWSSYKPLQFGNFIAIHPLPPLQWCQSGKRSDRELWSEGKKMAVRKTEHPKELLPESRQSIIRADSTVFRVCLSPTSTTVQSLGACTWIEKGRTTDEEERYLWYSFFSRLCLEVCIERSTMSSEIKEKRKEKKTKILGVRVYIKSHCRITGVSGPLHFPWGSKQGTNGFGRHDFRLGGCTFAPTRWQFDWKRHNMGGRRYRMTRRAGVWNLRNPSTAGICLVGLSSGPGLRMMTKYEK